MTPRELATIRLVIDLLSQSRHAFRSKQIEAARLQLVDLLSREEPPPPPGDPPTGRRA